MIRAREKISLIAVLFLFVALVGCGSDKGPSYDPKELQEFQEDENQDGNDSEALARLRRALGSGERDLSDLGFILVENEDGELEWRAIGDVDEDQRRAHLDRMDTGRDSRRRNKSGLGLIAGNSFSPTLGSRDEVYVELEVIRGLSVYRSLLAESISRYYEKMNRTDRDDFLNRSVVTEKEYLLRQVPEYYFNETLRKQVFSKNNLKTRLKFSRHGEIYFVKKSSLDLVALHSFSRHLDEGTNSLRYHREISRRDIRDISFLSSGESYFLYERDGRLYVQLIK